MASPTLASLRTSPMGMLAIDLDESLMIAASGFVSLHASSFLLSFLLRNAYGRLLVLSGFTIR
jgi:hypothetical protein